MQYAYTKLLEKGSYVGMNSKKIWKVRVWRFQKDLFFTWHAILLFTKNEMLNSLVDLKKG